MSEVRLIRDDEFEEYARITLDSYPAMFTDTDIVLLNKIDLQPHLDFDADNFMKSVTGLNPDVTIFPLSCKTGLGMDKWYAWLESAVKAKKSK